MQQTKTLIVKESTIPNAGSGLFAKRDYKPGQLICYLKGKIISNKTAKKMTPDDIRSFYLVDLGDKCLDTYNSGSLGIYANDADGLVKVGDRKNNSCFAITTKRDKVFLYATEHIKSGDEIFADYGEEYWKNLR